MKKMIYDSLVRNISTNYVSFDDGSVTKRYRSFSFPSLWGIVSGRPFRTALQRFRRELHVATYLYNEGLNVSHVIGRHIHKKRCFLKMVLLIT